MKSPAAFALLLLLLLLAAAPAAAQAPYAVGVGVGVGTGGYGPAVGPYFGPGLWGWGYGGWAGAAGSFWTNGLSLYGPPVPTFGITPGAFGGSDAYRLSGAAPGLYDPWFWATPNLRGPGKDFPPIATPPGWTGPRFATQDVKRRYAAEAADPGVALDRAYRDLDRANGTGYGRWATGRPLAQPCLRVWVRVTDPATPVWIQGEPTATTGTARLFESPPLTPGASYTYTVTAKPAGRAAETRSAAGRPGETVAVDFTRSAEGRP